MFRLFKNRKGFTLVEIIVTLTVVSILAVAGGFSLHEYTLRTEQNAINTDAKTIFLAAQNALSSANESQLNELVSSSDLVSDLVGGAWESAPSDWNTEGGSPNDDVRYNLYTISSSGNDEANALIRLLFPYLTDDTILSEAIVIEYNPVSKFVGSAFCSKYADNLVYSDGGTNFTGDVSIFNRNIDLLETRRVGFYGDINTGVISHTLDPFDAWIENGITLSVNWTDTQSANIPSTHISYRVTLYNLLKVPIYYIEYFSPATGYSYADGIHTLVLDSLTNGMSDFIKNVPATEFTATVEAYVSGGSDMTSVRRANSDIGHTYFHSETRTDGSSTYYVIDNIRHLNNIRYGGADFRYIQKCDIIYTNTSIPPIGNFPLRNGNVATGTSISGFSGEYDGKNCILTLDMSALSNGSSGLFSQIDDSGRLCGIVLRNFSVSGTSGRSGPLAADNFGTITNCSADTVTVIGGISGGLVGANNATGKIINCTITRGTVSAASSAGGIAGTNSGDIATSYAYLGSVTGGVSGGLVGTNYKNISFCYSSNLTVSATAYAGGLVGANSKTVEFSSVITNCYANGIKFVESGFVALISADSGNFGAICGTNSSTVISSYSNLFLVTDNSSITSDLLTGGGITASTYLLSSAGYNSGVTTAENSRNYKYLTDQENIYEDFDPSVWEYSAKAGEPNYPFLKLKALPHVGAWPEL